MITERDLKEAIAECQGVRSPKADTCIKLAAFYTIYEHMYGRTDQTEKHELPEIPVSYSFGAESSDIIRYDGETRFAQAIDGKSIDDILPTLDELMSILSISSPKLYNAVLEKLT